MLARGYGVRNGKDNEIGCLVEYNAITHYPEECFPSSFPFLILCSQEKNKEKVKVK
jgi:hypothetical protein